MGKTRNKERSEVEYLRGKIKRLESENRSLKKENRQLNKRAHFYDDIIEDFAGEVVEVGDEKCPACKKGEKKILDLNFVAFETCTICDYRKKLK